MTLFCALTVTPRALLWGRVPCTEEVTAEEAVEEATDTTEEATEAEAEEATEEAEAGEAVTEQVQQRGHSIIHTTRQAWIRWCLGEGEGGRGRAAGEGTRQEEQMPFFWG